MKPVAYGALSLKPWEFGRLTFDEFHDMVKGYEWRNEQKRITWCWIAVPIINACARNLKKSVTVETLLGYNPVRKNREEKNKNKTGEQRKEELAGLIKELGGR
ncbi:MAG: hypothetical protein P4N41_18160 [Negativicutes bacterium]|nr:hypothetical protein [Negativicutes bacterium]